MSEILVCAATTSRSPLSVTRLHPLWPRNRPGAVCKDSPSAGQGPNPNAAPSRPREGASALPPRVTLIPGDGIGPEVVDAARRTIEATSVAIEWDLHHMGSGAFSRTGRALPPETVASIRAT